MIKLKKIVAVALTAAMCLGLSMTAFASQSGSNDALWSPTVIQEPGSKTDPNSDQKVDLTDARDKNGHSVDAIISKVAPEAAKSIGSEVKVADAFRKAGYDVPKDVDFIPLWSGDLTFKNGVPADGGVLVFNVHDLDTLGIVYGPDGEDESAELQPGDSVYVMLETYDGSGVWEIYTAQVGPNGDFNVTIPHGGAIVVTKVMSDGTVVTLNKTTGEVIDRKPADNVANNATSTTGTSTTASGAKSPVTGEF